MTILTGTTEIKKKYITRCSPGHINSTEEFGSCYNKINEQCQIFYNLILMNLITHNAACIAMFGLASNIIFKYRNIILMRLVR